MIIYIASPYSGYDDKQAAVNVQIDAFAALRDAGHQPIAPLLSHYVDERRPASYERWMQWCLAMVSVADLVVRLPGESKGADLEVAEARRRGIPVVYGVGSVANPGSYYEVTGDVQHLDPMAMGAQAIQNIRDYFGITVNDELRNYDFVADTSTSGIYYEPTPGTPCVATVSVSVDALRQIRVLLGCIQRPTVSYDKDALTMAQAVVGYCGEMAAQIETLLPKDVSEQ